MIDDYKQGYKDACHDICLRLVEISRKAAKIKHRDQSVLQHFIDLLIKHIIEKCKEKLQGND